MNGQSQQPWPGQPQSPVSRMPMPYPQRPYSQGYPQGPPQGYPQGQPQGYSQQSGYFQQGQGMPEQQNPKQSLQGMTKTKAFVYGMLGFIAFCFIMFLISLATFYFKYVRK